MHAALKHDTRERAGRVGFQYEMGALESLAAGEDVGPGRNVHIMLESTAEVRLGLPRCGTGV